MISVHAGSKKREAEMHKCILMLALFHCNGMFVGTCFAFSLFCCSFRTLSISSFKFSLTVVSGRFVSVSVGQKPPLISRIQSCVSIFHLFGILFSKLFCDCMAWHVQAPAYTLSVSASVLCASGAATVFPIDTYAKCGREGRRAPQHSHKYAHRQL